MSVARGVAAFLLLVTAVPLRAQASQSGFTPIERDSATASLNMPITLVVAHEPLRTALEKLGRLSGVSLVFDDSLPGLGYRTTLHAQRMPLREAIARALEGSPLMAMTSRTGQIVFVVRPLPPARNTRVVGRIIDSATATPIAGVYVELVGTRFSAYSRDSGTFVLGQVPFGDYTLRVARLGYAPLTLPNVHITRTPSDTIVLSLSRASISLAEVIVTPGYFGLIEGSIAAPQRMAREQLETVPQIGEDIYRAVSRLPGVTADEFSAKFGVRGASGDELYVSLDGLELAEPFHLKDLGGAFSIIDIQALGSASLTTGGFSAEYGDRLTGVFTMRSVDPRTDRTRTSAGISLMNARLTSQGGFANGRGGWLFSARPGYLDLALKLTSVSDTYTPRYYDVFAKAQYDLASGGRIAIHLLSATDYLDYQVRNKPDITSRYGSNYLWATWDDKVGARTRFETVASGGVLGWRRNGEYSENDVQLAFVNDERTLSNLSLRQDWSFDAGERLLIKGGFEAKREHATYDYLSHIIQEQRDGTGNLRLGFGTTEANLSPGGTTSGLYFAPRLKPHESVTVEIGVRYDRTTQFDEGIVSPRLNLSWQPSRTTTLRAAWGRYTQSQPVFDLDVQDGLTQFRAAERAEQRIVGLDQLLPFGISGRVEAYTRRTTQRRTEFLNVAGDVMLLPELMWDRVRLDPVESHDRGLEFLVSRNGGRRMDWSVSYALAQSQDSVNGRMVPRMFDQRHGVHADWSLHPVSNTWRLTAGGVWHSGWPYTPTVLTIDTLVNTATQFHVAPVYTPGDVNSGRLPHYFRLDLRWTRFIETSNGRVSVFAELYNVFNGANPRGFWKELRVTGRRTSIIDGKNTQFPRLPVAGLSWEF